MTPHSVVQYAIKTGRLVKQPCEICESQDVLAHHDDYDEPLVVRWLCPKHHAQHHAKHGPGLNRPERVLSHFEVRIPQSLNAEIQRRALKGDRTKNAQIIRALRYYLDHVKEDE